MNTIKIIITCEHAVNTVPKEYTHLFDSFQHVLSTHKGIDFGALGIAEHLKSKLACDLIQASATRLLIDCNRSLHHAHCFSEITKHLNEEDKQKIITHYYLPFRKQVIHLIQHYITSGHHVLHLSIHSFTPVMNQMVRHTDIGLLYDPKRKKEKKLAYAWQKEIKKNNPQFRVRMNYPYKGTADGFTTALRQLFSENIYLGLEVESNQILVENTQSLNSLKNIVADSLLQLFV